jgi:hypothetical protein
VGSPSLGCRRDGPPLAGSPWIRFVGRGLLMTWRLPEAAQLTETCGNRALLATGTRDGDSRAVLSAPVRALE